MAEEGLLMPTVRGLRRRKDGKGVPEKQLGAGSSFSAALKEQEEAGAAAMASIEGHRSKV
jgi:hypothetical protein